jgi:hypothetical protein
MKRDLYAEVSARICAELERGATPWVKPWSATPGANTACSKAQAAADCLRGLALRDAEAAAGSVRARCEPLTPQPRFMMSTGSTGGPSRCYTRTASWRASSAARRAGIGGNAIPGDMPDGDAFGPFATCYRAYRDALMSVAWQGRC